MIIKYKLGELAKDLALTNKEVIAALKSYGTDKKHTTALAEEELDFLFDSLTQQRPVESLESYFVEHKPGSAPAAAKTAKSGDGKVDAAFQKKAAEKQLQRAERKPDKPLEVKERVSKVVDTRAAETNVEKYSEKYDKLAQNTGAGAARRNTPQGSKQKLKQRSQQRGGRQPYKKETEAERRKRLEVQENLRHAKSIQLKVEIPEEISVGELASRLKVTAAKVVGELMKYGEMKSASDVIDFDSASLIADALGAKVEREVHVTIEERLNIASEDETDPPESLRERPAVVVVMGHVDHGKTSLLDYIRNTKVIEGEAGGITQHIGAYRVQVGEKYITFLDTPGHEAFTSMRARGASVTDIAVLVVAADDGIMPQTVEAINHAKAAGVTIIVAINKMDKPEANAERVMQELTEYELVPEAWGGNVICVPVSAKTGLGIDDLLENITLVSEVLELKANPDRAARGTVIEARLDKGRGPVATLLIQNGTLHSGDVLIAGTSVGRIRAMTDDRGRDIEAAGPSTPVEITGLAEVPLAGDVFNAVADEKLARELVDIRRAEEKEEQFRAYRKVTLDNLFSQIAEGE
ncbi:MAG: translation initiation factor IF-2, partial [Oscillospiraceae bacterium]|nr:translation initiation factor IF-2 [Oscillospiraceae bacterium]